MKDYGIKYVFSYVAYSDVKADSPEEALKKAIYMKVSGIERFDDEETIQHCAIYDLEVEDGEFDPLLEWGDDM